MLTLMKKVFLIPNDNIFNFQLDTNCNQLKIKKKILYTVAATTAAEAAADALAATASLLTLAILTKL